MNSNRLILNMEASSGNGEDSHFIYDDAYSESVVLGVFDGLGGRSAGFDGITGGRIASKQAVLTTQRVLKQWNGRLNKDIAIEIQSAVCQALKSQAELNMGKSRLSGTLTGTRLCTTVAVASIPKNFAQEDGSRKIGLAWMGDSRVYFLSPQKGLQQLTKDDLEIDKDAFQIIREDPRMSQYLTADVSDDWQIHFAVENLEEEGCILVCTDGCFQYLPAPWEFEKLLLETLTVTDTMECWQRLLARKYEQIKQDDISLLLSPLGFTNFSTLSQAYQTRLEYVLAHYSTDSTNVSLNELWESYRSDYEARLHKDIESVVIEKVEVQASYLGEGIDGTAKTQSSYSDPKRESIDAGAKRDIQKKFSWDASSADPIHVNPSLESLTKKSHDRDLDLTVVRLEKVFKQAKKNVNVHQIKNVILECQEILKGHPNNLKIRFLLGEAHFCMGEFKNAINCFEIVNSQNIHDDPDCLRFIADAYFKIEDYAKSSSYFSRLEMIKDCQPYKYFKDDQLESYAFLLIKNGSLEHGLKVCDAIGYRNSNSPYANYLRGLIYHGWNLLEQAKKFLGQSLDAYEREFSKTRSEYLSKQAKTVRSEYEKVRDELNDQRRHLKGGD